MTQFGLPYSKVSDWVVVRRVGGNVLVASHRLGTTMIVPESDLSPVDRGESACLPLTVGGPEPRTANRVAAATDGSSLPSVAGSVRATTSPGAREQLLPATHDHPVARYTDPASAHNAARIAHKTLTENQRRVLLAHADAGERGLSGDELADVLGGEQFYALLGPRRPQLERARFLEKAGTRLNRRGNEVQVYRCTLSGFALARQWQKVSA